MNSVNIEKLNEAVNLLKTHIDVFEAIKRVLFLFGYRIIHIEQKFPEKWEAKRSLNQEDFFKKIDASSSEWRGEHWSFQKYADDIPEELFRDIIRIISEVDVSENPIEEAVKNSILNTFLSPQNIRDEIFKKKAPQTPHSLRKLIHKLAFYYEQGTDYLDEADKSSFADIFLGLDETFIHKFTYMESLKNILASFHCSELEREFLFAFLKHRKDGNYVESYSMMFLKQIVVYCNPIDSPSFASENTSPEYHDDFFSKTISNHLGSFEEKMIAVVPFKSLSDQGKIKRLLKSLIGEKTLRAIIELPENLFLPYTSMATALLIIQKSSNVGFARRPSFTNKKGKIEIQHSDIQALSKRIKRSDKDRSPMSDWKYFVEVGSDDIKRNNYDLNPSLYLDSLDIEINKLNADRKGKPLKELAEIVIGENKYVKKQGDRELYIRYSDLNADKRDLFLNPERIDDLKKIKKTDLRFVKKKSILVSIRAGRAHDLKPTIFDDGILEKMAISLDLKRSQKWRGPFKYIRYFRFFSGLEFILFFNEKIAAIIPDEKIVDIEYLYFQLYNPLVIRQIESKLFASYKKTSRLTIEDLGSLIIPFERSLEAQIEIVQKEKIPLLDQNFIDHQKEMIAYRELLGITEIKQDSQLVGHLRHNIRPKLQSVKGPIKRIRKFIEKENLQDSILTENIDGTPEKMKDALGQAEKSIDSIGEVLDAAKRFTESKIDRNEFKKMNICDIFTNDIKPHYTGKQYNIKIIGGNVKGKVYVHYSFFCEAIHNIIRNAEMHAFEVHQKDQEVIFEISENYDSVMIEYTNNGKKFPDNMTIQDFFTWGMKGKSSKGEGIGGALIGKMIDAHNGLFEIIRDDNPVHFRITFPKVTQE